MFTLRDFLINEANDYQILLPCLCTFYRFYSFRLSFLTSKQDAHVALQPSVKTPIEFCLSYIEVNTRMCRRRVEKNFQDFDFQLFVINELKIRC